MPYRISIEKTKRQPTAQIAFRARDQELPAKFPEVFGEVASYLGRHGIPFEGPAFASYVMNGDEFQVEAGFLVKEKVPGEGRVVPGELPECEAARTTHVGPHESMTEAYDAIQAWATENGHELQEPMWEFYFSGPSTPPSEVRTEIYWPLKPKS